MREEGGGRGGIVVVVLGGGVVVVVVVVVVVAHQNSGKPCKNNTNGRLSPPLVPPPLSFSTMWKLMPLAVT